jgi:hypothetical protein
MHLYSLLSFWTSFLLLELLLVQGAVYWFVKWMRLRSENTSITPIRIVQKLRSLKKINVGFILIIPGAFIADYVKWQPSLPLSGIFFSVFIYIFAILEFINYFHIQLSYDNPSDIKSLLKSKQFKQACLSKDFERL